LSRLRRVWCLGLAVAWGAAGCQPCAGDAVRAELGGSMAEHCGQEEVPAELVYGGGRMRDHGRRARDVTQQGDLAHSFAASVPAQEVSVMQDVEFTRGDRIVGISPAALLDQDGAGGQVEWCEGRREAFDRGC